MVDHIAEEWARWRMIIRECEQQKNPINWWQVQSIVIDGFNGTELALDIWSFISRYIGRRLYDRRAKLGVNIEGNGFELWRRLFYDHEGSSELIALAGRTKLLSFPRCRDKRKLGQHFDDWVDMFQTYGADIGPEVGMTLFLGILPEDMRDRIHQDMNLRNMTLIQLMEWARMQMQWTHQEMLASHVSDSPHVASLSSPQRPPGRPQPRGPPGSPRGQPPPGPPGGPPRLRRQRPPGTYPKGPPGTWPKDAQGRSVDPRIKEFRGCHHCGSLDHPRSQCDAYKKCLDPQGRRLPNYQGAIDKCLEETGEAFYSALDSSKQSVNSLAGDAQADKNDIESATGTESDDFSSEGEMSMQDVQMHCPVWTEVRHKKIKAFSSIKTAGEILPPVLAKDSEKNDARYRKPFLSTQSRTSNSSPNGCVR